MNHIERLATKRSKKRLDRLATIKYSFEQIEKFSSDIEWDIRTNFPEGFNFFTNEEILYIREVLGFEIEYHFGIFKVQKIKTRNAKNNYRLQ